MLRTYSVTPWESPAILCALIGNIQGLQDLFTARQASPFDRVGNTDLTLLHVSSLYPSIYDLTHSQILQCVGRTNRKEMVEFLLSQGADPNSSDRLPLCSAVVPGVERAGKMETQSVIEAMHLLLQHIDVNYETAEDAVEHALRWFLGTPEEFTLLQQHICPSFNQLPKQARIRLALPIVNQRFWFHFQAELIRTIIGMDDLAAADINNDIHFSWTKSSTLIHAVAGKIGMCQRNLHLSYHARHQQQASDSHGDLLRELLRLGADAHTIANDMTSFQAFLQGYFLKSTLSQFQNGNKACNSAIQAWLCNLEAVGIDLAAYGETEQYNWMNKASRREFSAWNIEEQCHDTQRVIGFAYGPSPKDWHIWLPEASDPFVGEFWDMIERPVEEMPGSWPEH